jgi:hypothetical protein
MPEAAISSQAIGQQLLTNDAVAQHLRGAVRACPDREPAWSKGRSGWDVLLIGREVVAVLAMSPASTRAQNVSMESCFEYMFCRNTVLMMSFSRFIDRLLPHVAGDARVSRQVDEIGLWKHVAFF